MKVSIKCVCVPAHNIMNHLFSQNGPRILVGRAIVAKGQKFEDRLAKKSDIRCLLARVFDVSLARSNQTLLFFPFEPETNMTCMRLH